MLHRLTTLVICALCSQQLDAAPKRLSCISQTGENSKQYWSQQAAKNRAFGQTEKATQLEIRASYCEASKYGRKVVITFDEAEKINDAEQPAEFQIYTLCGMEGGEIIPARIKVDGGRLGIAYYHPSLHLMRYFNIDQSSLKGGFRDQSDFQCRHESYDLSDKLL